MTTDTLAKLAADLEQLASEGPELIHTQSGAYISQKLSEAAKALAAQALPAAGRCDECGKDQAEGWALYCVGCLEKTGLLAKEALPNAQHVSSTAADLTGPNDTAAQATTGAAAHWHALYRAECLARKEQVARLGSEIEGLEAEAAQALHDTEPFGYFKAQPFGWTDCAEDDDGAVALYEGPQQAEQALTEALALSDDALSHAINQAACDIAADRAPDDRIRAIGRALWRQWQAQQAAQATALTDHEIETLAHRMCWRYKHDGDSYGDPAYTFNKVTLIDFVRRVGAGSVSGWPALLAGAALQQSVATMESAAAHLDALPKMHQGKLLAHDLRRAVSCCETALAALSQSAQPQSAQTKGDAS